MPDSDFDSSSGCRHFPDHPSWPSTDIPIWLKYVPCTIFTTLTPPTHPFNHCLSVWCPLRGGSVIPLQQDDSLCAPTSTFPLSNPPFIKNPDPGISVFTLAGIIAFERRVSLPRPSSWLFLCLSFKTDLPRIVFWSPKSYSSFHLRYR